MHNARSAVEGLKHNGSRYSIIARISSCSSTAVSSAVSKIGRNEIMQARARDKDSYCESPIDVRHIVMRSLIRLGSPPSLRPATTSFASVRGEWMYPGHLEKHPYRLRRFLAVASASHIAPISAPSFNFGHEGPSSVDTYALKERKNNMNRGGKPHEPTNNKV